MKQDKSYSRVDRGWSQMEQTLDIHMPKKKRRYLFILWYLIGLTVLILSSYWIKDSGSVNEKMFQNEATVPVAEQIKEDDSSNEVNGKPFHSEEDSKVETTVVSTQVNDNKITQGRERNSSTDGLNETRNEVKTLNLASSEEEKVAALSMDNDASHDLIDSDYNPVDENELPAVEIDVDGTASKNTIGIINADRPIISSPIYVHTLNFEVIDLSEVNITEIEPVLALKEIEPVLVSCCVVKDDVWFGVHGERIFDFDAYGIGISAGYRHRLNAKWSLGMSMAYTRNTKHFLDGASEDEAMQPDTAADIPAGFEGLLDSSEADRNAYVLESNDTLSSVSLGLSALYQINRKFHIGAGVGVDRYFQSFQMAEARDLQITNGNETTLIVEQARWVPVLSTEVGFSLSRHFSLSFAYRHAIRNFNQIEGVNTSTSKMTAGLNYIF